MAPIFQAALYVNDAWVRSISFYSAANLTQYREVGRAEVIRPGFSTIPNIADYDDANWHIYLYLAYLSLFHILTRAYYYIDNMNNMGGQPNSIWLPKNKR